MTTTAAIAIAAVVGLCVGSFLNVVVWRLPRGLSVVSPPSACPTCGTTIAPYDNVPVLSWVVLRGRCRVCRAPISPRYPLVEAGCAIVWALCAWQVEPGGAVPAFLAGATALLASSWVDVDRHPVQHRAVLGCLVAAAAGLTIDAGFDERWGQLIRAGLGALIAITSLVIIRRRVSRHSRPGLPALAGLCGLMCGWVGWRALAIGLTVAMVFTGLTAAAQLRKGRRGGPIPVVPAFAAATLLAVLIG